jgi:hypothetical protein
VQRVAAGAALLDTKAPGWAGKVDVGELEIANPEWCVLGQVFGGYVEGKAELGILAGGEHGFAEISGVDEAQAERLWREAISVRRAR